MNFVRDVNLVHIVRTGVSQREFHSREKKLLAGLQYDQHPLRRNGE